MSLVPRPHPPARGNGALREVLPDVFFVTGGTAMPGPLPVHFSRNMTILRDGDRLVLVNTLRLDDAGLAALDALGKVTDIVRLAGNHGSDDPFYAERYGATVWVVPGQRYTAGFDTRAENVYFDQQRELDPAALPVRDAHLHVIHSAPPEGVLVLDRDVRIAVTGDSLQNWAAADEHFSLLGRWMMGAMGFLRPHNVGPGWLRQCKPPKDELRALLDLGVTHVLPGHGTPVLGEASGLFRPAVEKATA